LLALEHEETQLKISKKQNRRKLIAKARLSYYQSPSASEIEVSYSKEEAKIIHELCVKKIYKKLKKADRKKRELKFRVKRMKSKDEWEKVREKIRAKLFLVHRPLREKLREIVNEMSKGEFNYPEEKRRKMIFGPGVMFGLPRELQSRLDAE
jgi:hypothetical protein